EISHGSKPTSPKTWYFTSSSDSRSRPKQMSSACPPGSWSGGPRGVPETAFAYSSRLLQQRMFGMPGLKRGGFAYAISGSVSRRNLIRTGTAGVATYALASTAGVIDPEPLLGQETSPEPALREFVFTA